MMELFYDEIVNDFYRLTIFAKALPNTYVTRSEIRLYVSALLVRSSKKVFWHLVLFLF